MRILVCAHDFAPNPSPQSLRITQLVAELASAGSEIDVLTRTVGAGMPVQPEWLIETSPRPSRWAGV